MKSARFKLLLTVNAAIWLWIFAVVTLNLAYTNQLSNRLIADKASCKVWFTLSFPSLSKLHRQHWRTMHLQVNSCTELAYFCMLNYGWTIFPLPSIHPGLSVLLLQCNHLKHWQQIHHYLTEGYCNNFNALPLQFKQTSREWKMCKTFFLFTSR